MNSCRVVHDPKPIKRRVVVNPSRIEMVFSDLVEPTTMERSVIVLVGH